VGIVSDQGSSGFRITAASYGKDLVRLVTWTEVADGHDVRDVSLTVNVEGDFHASYLDGDNSRILPSDTLRRHALAEAELSRSAPVEHLIAAIAARLLAANPAFTAVRIEANSRVWSRTGSHSFQLAPWRSIARLRLTRAGEPNVTGAISDLSILATTGSAFAGFLRDGLTVQPESSDRPICGTLDATWAYHEPPATPIAPGAMVAGITAALSDRRSNAIQQLLTDAGQRILTQYPELASLTLTFRSLPLSPLPGDLPGARAGYAAEVGDSPIGLTQVELLRGGI
jgi:urate oxidase